MLHALATTQKDNIPLTFDLIGFCGADDSVSLVMIELICQSYLVVEFGILLDTDKVS